MSVLAARPSSHAATSRISVVVVAYDAGLELVGCLGSLRRPGEAGPEVLVVDNGGLEPALTRAVRRYATQLIVPSDDPATKNIGFAAACNLGAASASGDVLVFLNPDTLAAAGALEELAHALDDPSVGIAMARLRLLREPELLNSSGNVLHITGLGWVGGFREQAEAADELREIAFPSGAAMAMRADLFRALGGFREEFFLYHEDVDLGWRVRQRGLRVVMTPTADVYHDYSPELTPSKRYFLERNRLAFVLSDFSLRLLLVLAPVLVATEAAMAVLAWKQGWLRQKAAGWLWCARNLGTLRRRRRETRSARRVRDRELVRLLTPIVEPTLAAAPAVVRLLNPLLAAYWAVARRVL